MNFHAWPALIVAIAIVCVLPSPGAAQIIVNGYGATLGTGPNWAGFPSRLAPNLVNPAGSTPQEQLNGTYNVYLVTETDGADINSCPRQISGGPILLTSTSWWNSTIPLYTSVLVEYGSPFDNVYHACPSGQGIEVTLNSDGTLTLLDARSGGLRDRFDIILQFCTTVQQDPFEHCHVRYFVRIRLDPPGRYTDKVVDCSGPAPLQYSFDDVDALPGTQYTGLTQRTGEYQVDIMVPKLIVEWVSTDVSGTSVRNVDAGDLAALSAELGYRVRWGFPGEQLPYLGAPAQNYKVNFAPFGDLSTTDTSQWIDAQDLAAFAADLGTNCNSSKAEAIAERERIMTYFGFARTGNSLYVEPSGLLPEYVLANAEQNRRAIDNPFGYENWSAGAQMSSPSAWTLVKGLYR